MNGQATAKPRKHWRTDVDVTVTVDIGDLVDNGWHHEDDCPAAQEPQPEPPTAALESLHRQAHPSQPRAIAACHEEPCRSLTLDQLRAIGGRDDG